MIVLFRAETEIRASDWHRLYTCDVEKPESMLKKRLSQCRVPAGDIGKCPSRLM
jgi:hypothetical protein